MNEYNEKIELKKKFENLQDLSNSMPKTEKKAW